MKPFTDTLRELNNGKFVEQLTEGLADLVRDCQATGKAGTMTVVLKLKPAKGNNVITVEQDYKLKSPVFDQPQQFFFIAEGGSLVTENPSQRKLDLQDVRVLRGTDGTTERIDADTGEITRVPIVGAAPLPMPGQQQQTAR